MNVGFWFVKMCLVECIVIYFILFNVGELDKVMGEVV